MDLLVIGLNPALQKTLTFNELVFGEVNRSMSIDVATGGKGPNFCRAAKTWGNSTMLFQFLGGNSGRQIADILKCEDISHNSVWVDAETRTCTTCLCQKSSTMTELIEPSGIISETESNKLLEKIKQQIPNSNGVALCGTFPPGITSEFYAAVATFAKNHQKPVMLDAWKNIDPVLEVGIDILKINRQELSQLTGKTSLQEAIDYCFATYDIHKIAITDGPKQAFFCEKKDSLWTYRIPQIDQVVNPLGAGDTVAAVMFCEIINGASAADAFAQGLAAGSASCLNLKVADYFKDRAIALFRSMNYSK